MDTPENTIEFLRMELEKEIQFRESLLRSLETMTRLFADIVEQQRKRNAAKNK